MKSIVDILQNYRIFQTLRPNVIVKIFQYMEIVEFIRGTTIYIEGFSKTDAVYFIKEGEFSITKAAGPENPEQTDLLLDELPSGMN